MPGAEGWLAGALAGLVAIGVTRLVERTGGVFGGVVGTVPTTIVPAVAGMAAAGEPGELLLTLAAVPAGMLGNACFLAAWRILPGRLGAWRGGQASLGPVLLGALLTWAAVSLTGLAASGWLLGRGAPPRAVAAAGLLVMASLGVASCWRLGPAPAGSRPVGPWALASRGIMAALAVGGAVGIADLGYPLLAGVASVFPAIFLTTMVSLWWAQGPSVPTGAAGPMTLGGGAVSVYVLVAMSAIPALGLALGSLVAWLLSVALWSVPGYAFLRWRQRVAAGPP